MKMLNMCELGKTRKTSRPEIATHQQRIKVKLVCDKMSQVRNIRVNLA
jgi:hypothetical protein